MWPFSKRSEIKTPEWMKDPERIEDKTDKMRITKLERSIRKERLEYLEERLESLRQRQQEELLERKIGDAEGDLEPDDDDDDPEEAVNALQSSPEQMFMGILSQVIAAKNRPQMPQNQAQGLPPDLQTARPRVSDDQLREARNKVPPSIISMLRTKSDDEILQLARLYYPDQLNSYDPETIARAIAIIKED